MGGITFATIGPGLVLAENADGYLLQAATTPRYWGEKPARQADGSYVIQHPATTLTVFRNGLRQHAGDDYTFEPATRKIMPVAAYPWADDDLILVDYE